jgi:hypothetical protein
MHQNKGAKVKALTSGFCSSSKSVFLRSGSCVIQVKGGIRWNILESVQELESDNRTQQLDYLLLVFARLICVTRKRVK